jgi:hypothetical protein
MESDLFCFAELLDAPYEKMMPRWLAGLGFGHIIWI